MAAYTTIDEIPGDRYVVTNAAGERFDAVVVGPYCDVETSRGTMGVSGGDAVICRQGSGALRALTPDEFWAGYSPETQPEDLSELTAEALRDLAAEAGVTGTSKMRKADLIAAIEAARDGTDA